MKEEEVAKRIIEMYLPYVDCQGGITDELTNNQLELQNAIKCALIHVTEIMNTMEFIYDKHNIQVLYYTSDDKSQYYYWKGVKAYLESI